MPHDAPRGSLIKNSIGMRVPVYSREEWGEFEKEVGFFFPEDVVWMASRAPEFFIEVDVEDYPDPPEHPDPLESRVERMRVRLPHPGMSRQDLAERSSEAWDSFSPAIGSGGVVSFVDESDPSGFRVDQHFPFRAYPETPVMLPWGEDLSGCCYFWVPTEGARGWRLLLTAENHAQWVDMPLLDLLEGLVSREFVSPVLGEDCWSNASVEFVEPEAEPGSK